MYFCAARAARKLPFRWVLITPSQSSSDILKSRLSRVMPATATRMSRRPSSCAVRAAAASICSGFVTSTGMATARPPAERIWSAVSSAGATSRSMTATAAPSAASLAAVAAEFLETGGMRTHQRLVDEHPPGLAPLLRARGFGPAGVQALHAALGATDLDGVEQAGREGRLAQAVGPRRAAALLAELPDLRSPVRP